MRSETHWTAPSPEFYSAIWVSLKTLSPPPALSLPEWSDRYRRVPQGTSVHSGRWSSTRFPWQMDPMLAVTDPATEEVVLMWSSQVGKTEILLCALAFFAHWDPSAVLLIQPTEGLVEAFSKERIAPMIAASPELARTFADPGSRKSGNTLTMKSYPGGFLAMSGANAPSGLASRPIRVLLADEVDRWPASAGTEGDPLSLGRKRTRTYWNRLILQVSSPGVKGISRIARSYEASSQERFSVPCPRCGERQPLVWESVKWPPGQPELARYECRECASLWSQSQLNQGIRLGQYIAERPEVRKVRGFHVNELAATPLAELAAAFLEAKDAPETLQVFVNTSLAELWEGEGDTVPAEQLWMENREPIEAVPPGTVLTAGVDVQADRLEVEVVAWEPTTRDSWSVSFDVIHGDPRLAVTDTRGPWVELDELLQAEYPVAGGGLVTLRAAFVDAGYLPDEVMSFTRGKGRRGIYASRGEAGAGKAWIIGHTRHKRTRARVYRLGVDALKGALYRYLAAAEGEPGRCRFPMEYQLGHFERLTAERAVTRYRAGHPFLAWELPSGARNEQLDCRVYAMAALERAIPRRAAILRRNRGGNRGPK